MSVRSIINFKDALDLSIGVNVRLLQDGRQEIAYCILRQEKEIVTLVEKRDDVKSIDELYSRIKTYIEKGVRVHVNCVGRSVLTKIIEGQEVDASRQWSTWFPGISADQFIFQRFTRTNFTALSLLRREDVQKSNLFLDDGASSFSMGVCIAESIASIVAGKSINVEGSRVDFDDNNRIQSITLVSEPWNDEYKIGGDPIPASCVLAYASAFNAFLPVEELELDGLPEVVEHGHERYHANARLHKVGKLVIVSLLCLLPLNVVLYFWLDGAVTEMESTLQFRQGSRKTMEQTANSTRKLSNVYDALGYSSNRIPLYYADQLAKTMPVEIQLNVLQTGILDEKTLRSERKLQFDAMQIVVRGTSKDPAVLNNWIAELNRVDWVDKIQEQKYQYEPRLGKGVFEILILVKPR